MRTSAGPREVDGRAAEAAGERQRTPPAFGRLEQIEAGEDVDGVVEQRIGAPVPALAVLLDEPAHGLAQLLVRDRLAAGEEVAEEQGDLLARRVRGERQVGEPAVTVDAGGALGAPLGDEAGESLDPRLEVAALTLEVGELVGAQPLEVEDGILGEHAGEAVAAAEALALLRGGVLVLVVEQIVERAGADRPEWIAEHAREPLAVDREQRFVVALFLGREARALPVVHPQHPPVAEEVEYVCEREPLAAQLEVDADARLARGARLGYRTRQLADDGLLADPLERCEREEEQRRTPAVEAGPLVPRTLAPGDRARADPDRPAQRRLGRALQKPGERRRRLELVTPELRSAPRELPLMPADEREGRVLGADERRLEQRPGRLLLLLEQLEVERRRRAQGVLTSIA